MHSNLHSCIDISWYIKHSWIWKKSFSIHLKINKNIIFIHENKSLVFSHIRVKKITFCTDLKNWFAYFLPVKKSLQFHFFSSKFQCWIVHSIHYLQSETRHIKYIVLFFLTLVRNTYGYFWDFNVNKQFVLHCSHFHFFNIIFVQWWFHVKNGFFFLFVIFLFLVFGRI